MIFFNLEVVSETNQGNIMANYEQMSTQEVQRLAKQGDKDALYEMVWRIPTEVKNNPVECCAWQDYWFEKAADSGHIDAKSRYARSLINRIDNAECRQKAIGYFQSLVDDFDAGELTGDQMIDGIISKLWLGIMLCQGFGTLRDPIKGRELIKVADTLTNGFEQFGFGPLKKLGEVYGQGCTQSGGEPSIDDLKQAIKYQEIAINRFNAERDDPHNRGFLELAKNYLETLKKRKDNKEEFKRQTGNDPSTYNPNFFEWQKKMMEISPKAQERVEADKVAMKRLQERLAREGY